ncbi:MAG TPA: DUF4097 family beta strand repeat-containing protein [Candidatus Angelobacter sp.]|nr:DUF4097 family beta strand repeat-containing protein [Candidatus Angelobacter sp.]
MKLFPTNAAARIAARTASSSALLIALTLLLSSANAADNHKQSRLDIAPGGNVTIVNNGGSVTLHSAASGHQVLIAYTTHSDKVEVDQNATPDKQRIELLTHAIAGQKPTADEARVDYELTVPAGVSVNVTTVSAPITSDGLTGDVSLSSETGQIDVHNMSKSHLHARSMSAPVTLTAITATYIDVQSSGGPVHLSKVTGPRVAVATANGNIDYHGDCAGGGDYRFSTHSGDIEMWLPAYASVDLSARSRSGSVDNEFPLAEKQHQVNPPIQGRSFAGTSNSGSSSVELQSISGKIRVKKQ